MGPLRRFALNTRIRFVGRRNGLGREDINTVIDGVSGDDDFKACCTAYEQQGGTLPVQLKTGEDENGNPIIDFFKWLLQWLASPEGQGFLKFIFSLFGFIIA